MIYYQEAGIEYVADWPLDDQPVELKTASGKKGLFNPLPSGDKRYPYNDLAAASSEEFAKRCIDQFDRLYEESAEITRIMGISMHTYVSGAPHRYKYVEQVYKHITSKPDVLIWTGEQVIDWYKTQI